MRIEEDIECNFNEFDMEEDCHDLEMKMSTVNNDFMNHVSVLKN